MMLKMEEVVELLLLIIQNATEQLWLAVAELFFDTSESDRIFVVADSVESCTVIFLLILVDLTRCC